MAVTIKDIAQAAGVSHPTVSRALRGEPGVTPEKAMRVRHIARELGYIPDLSARSLKTSRTRVIGVLVHRVSDPFYSQVLDGIQDALYSAGYAVFLASSNNDRQRRSEIIRAMIERRVDGLIICSMYLSPKDFSRDTSWRAPRAGPQPHCRTHAIHALSRRLRRRPRDDSPPCRAGTPAHCVYGKQERRGASLTSGLPDTATPCKPPGCR